MRDVVSCLGIDVVLGIDVKGCGCESGVKRGDIVGFGREMAV